MKKLTFFLFTLAIGIPVFSQHEHHAMQDSLSKVIDTMDNRHSMHTMPSHAYSKSLPMSRNGSGTGWNPDASPMYMWLRSKGRYDWMFHGNIFLRYTSQDVFSSGSRGGDEFSSPNWFMAMMNRKVGKKGLLNATAMISLDRITDGGNGYPLLFQSGETYKGQRLIDRQHPHDLFSALSIGYTQMLNRDIDVFAYLGYPGEPALGAPAFMHRISAMNNPDAPLGHHWQDATHITFGTGTVGIRYKKFKAEGSVFTGREPDENRFNFDGASFDSYSYRISFNPAENWALQFSQGFINSPEALEPGEDVKRTSASVLFVKKLKIDKHISAAAIWGLNDKGADHKENSFLLEGNYQVSKNAFFARYEYVQKSNEELNLGQSYPHRNFNIHGFSLGYNRRILQIKKADIAAGTQFTLYGVDKGLRSLYGKMPVGVQLYIQIRPFLHSH
ncbi:MAG TPA: hypothetical protein VFV31_12650 [Chitinophagaceae bacterium]|nr:hypothetical protein [Chitinophagaceae bacterium]